MSGLMLIPYSLDKKLDVSLRALVDYHIGTDTHIVRLDVKVGSEQLGVGFHTGSPVAGSDLSMPKNYDGFSVRANSQDVVDALRGMADRLEQEIKK